MSTQYSEYPVLNFLQKPETGGISGLNGLPVLTGTQSTRRYSEYCTSTTGRGEERRGEERTWHRFGF
jgi:hypothetical protein